MKTIAIANVLAGMLLIGAAMPVLFAQEPVVIQDGLDSKLTAEFSDRAAALAKRAAELGTKLDDKNLRIDVEMAQKVADAEAKIASMRLDMIPQLLAPAAPDAPPAPAAPKAKVFMFRPDSAYNAGTKALDEHNYAEAVTRFESAAAQEPAKAEGALYWKAYALNREGKRDEALAAIAQLRKEYPASAWLKDAQVLEAEVKQSSGKPVSPEQETNDDLKLLAINSLLSAEAERALPLLEGILNGNGGPGVRDRALFVLAQSRSPKAQQALVEYAKGGGNPDLQLKAIQYVGMSGTRDSQQLLGSLYGSQSTAQTKNAVLQALMMARASDALLNIAKTEKDATLRDSAIHFYLASTKNVTVEGLQELLAVSGTAQTKREVLLGMATKGDAKTLIGLARKAPDAATKKLIVEQLSNMHDNKDAMDYMMELLK